MLNRNLALLLLTGCYLTLTLPSQAKGSHWRHKAPPSPTPTATPKPSPTPSSTPTPTPTLTPTPTPTPSATPTPPPGSIQVPRGIFYLLSTDAPISSKQACWTNPSVHGVRLRVSIGSVEPQDGVYDWTQLDAASALAAANGKQWTVGVIWGMACPPWVYTAGAKPVTLSDGIMPTPWDPVVLAKELAFLQAFAARYGNDPSLAGVMIGGLGQVMETYVARTPADSAILNPLGGVPAWIAAGQTLITAFAEALPNKSVILTAAVPFPIADSGDDALNELGTWAAANYPNFGVMCASLSVDSSVFYPPNALISAYSLTHPCGFQFVSSSGDVSRLGGTLAQALTAGVSLLQGRGMIETYGVDCSDPGNAATLLAAGLALQE